MATLILDDRDPDILYSTGWSQGGAPTEYNSTTTYTDNAGATMTLIFQGIGVIVYGTIGSSNSQRVAPQTTYQLDGSQVVTYVPTLTASAQHYQRFYQSAQVPKGQHSLIVTNIIGGCDPFFIDYLVVQTGNASSTTVTTAASVSPSNSEHNPSRTAVIAGSVSAALACILLLVLMYFLKRKRRNSSGLSNEPSVVSPFQHTMDQRPGGDNPKTPRTQLRPPVDEYNHGSSSHREVAPPAYIP